MWRRSIVLDRAAGEGEYVRVSHTILGWLSRAVDVARLSIVASAPEVEIR
jgi:hypothetical protein